MRQEERDDKLVMQNIRAWYNGHADSFAGTDVVELPFIGLDAGAQKRLNDFKLQALGHGRVDFTGKDVLDFGAGHGRLALAFPTMRSYTGVDYSENLVQLGNERLRKAGHGGWAKLNHGDCYKYPAPDSAFDVVCSLGMFCYLPDPQAMLIKMARHLRPGGTLFMDFRSSSPLYDPVRKLKWKIWQPTGGTTGMWTTERMVSMLDNAGLRDAQLVMREYPFLGDLHARKAWAWPLNLRDSMAERRGFDLFATEGWAFARKPAH